jgi:hypothetical protein
MALVLAACTTDDGAGSVRDGTDKASTEVSSTVASTIATTTTVPADTGGLRYREVADEAGLATLHAEQVNNGPAVMLGGVAVADVDSDGDPTCTSPETSSPTV